LAGLPADFVDSHPVDDDGLVTLTTEWPDRNPVMKYASDRALRQELLTVHESTGWPDNDAVLRELMNLRTEHAQLLGYDGWPDVDAEVRMIGSGPAIGGFIDELDELVRPVAKREIDVLLDFLRADGVASAGVGREDFRYYLERVRRERYDVDAQRVREYFDFGRVREGLFEVTSRLFGLDYRDVPDAAVWHPEVTVHDVYVEGTEQLLGRVYLDLHPRPGKYSHAAQCTLATGVAGRQLPEAVLVCNFARGLVDHDDAMVMFHEFGHVLHHLFSGSQPWLAFSGAESVDLDFLEAPSQMLEEWAWDADVLRSFAVDASGTPIPADLVKRMRVAEEFGKGLETARQVFYTAVSYEVHLPASGDLDALVADLSRRYDPTAPSGGGHIHAGFVHLIDYASTYYTYQWSLVIAKDLFSAFDPNDLLDSEMGTQYRDAILAPGGGRDAALLVEDFLGRPYSFEPYRRWLTGTEPAPDS
jgi:thimet oligopeptidase